MPNEMEDESLGVEQLPQDEMEVTPTKNDEQLLENTDNSGVRAVIEDSTSSSQD